MHRSLTFAAACALAGATASITPAQAYPIDCAILLCMAGGFPASVECSRAKAEVIRRITPWPVEPPLQLWRCPMGISAEDAALAGIPAPQLGPDGLTPEVRAYRDAMEIYHIRYRRWRDKEGDIIVDDSTQAGTYGRTGEFSWRRASYEEGPAWLADAVGGRRIPLRVCIRDNDTGCLAYQTIGTINRGARDLTSLRGVAFRYRDYTGTYHHEFVRY